MKQYIDVFDYCGTICKGIRNGALLTTSYNGCINTMTIGWGHLGIEWNLPVFVAYIRESRYTRELLDNSSVFTVNITENKAMANVIRFCGTMSGRDTDKIRELGLTLIEGEKITAPGIKEFPITLECKVLYRQQQEGIMLPAKLAERFYPVCDQECRRDYHIAYYAQIVNAYVIEE